MGWFDNEQDAGNPPTGTAAQPSTPRPASPRPSSGNKDSTGSTLGRQIHIDGTIVCDEDLTILGKVDGTIRAKGTLTISTDADVHAKIDGQRVIVHGKVDGDVEGAELVVIGQTGHLTGNIRTPTLEIVEGAHFKGSVDMKPARSEPAKPSVEASGGKPKPVAERSDGPGPEKKTKPAVSATGAGAAAAQKQGPS